MTQATRVRSARRPYAGFNPWPYILLGMLAAVGLILQQQRQIFTLQQATPPPPIVLQQQPLPASGANALAALPYPSYLYEESTTGLTPWTLPPAAAAEIPGDLVQLDSWESMALWPTGYTPAFYQVLSETVLAVKYTQEGTPDYDSNTACYVTAESSYIVYVVRDDYFSFRDFGNCLAHETGHLIDARQGYPSASEEFHQAVLLSILAAQVPENAEASWTWIARDVMAPWAGVLSELQPGQWGGYGELYAELFQVVRSYGDYESEGGMLESIPPLLRPWYELWLKNTRDPLPVPTEAP